MRDLRQSFIGMMMLESYYISTTDYSDVEVSRKLWEELFGLLQEARSETPEPETYEEFFKDFYKE